MADDTAELLVRIEADIEDLKDKLSEGQEAGETFGNKLKETFGDLGTMLAELFAAEKIKEFFEEGIKLFAEFDKQLTITQGNLERLGLATGDTRQQMADWAKQIQDTTLFTKDEALGTLNKFVNTTGNLNDALGLSKLAMDVATGAGLQLTQVQKALGEAFEGHSEKMGRLLIQFPKLQDQIKAGGNAIEILTKQFAGAADAVGEKGLAGQLFHLKTTWDELAEDFAQQNATSISEAISGFKSLAAAVGEIIKVLLRVGESLGTILGAIYDESAAFVERMLANFKTLWLAISGHPMEAYHQWKNANTTTLYELISTAKGTVQQLEAIWSNEGKTEVKQLQATTNAKLAIEAAANKARVDAAVKAKAEENKAKEELDFDYIKFTDEGLDILISLQDSHNKSTVELAKDAAVAKAIINTATGITNAISDYGWPFDLIVGAIVAAEGAVEIAKIEGVQLATGGIVTAPTPALIGEGGEPEAVVPLSKAGEMGFGGGGGRPISVTNVYPGVRNKSDAKGVTRTAARAFLAVSNSTKYRQGQRNS